jgi:2-dehydro-3-deoxyphosphogluconate aldolase/(4S)-4-hydroxy-2-oxoglutarate aldolase
LGPIERVAVYGVLPVVQLPDPALAVPLAQELVGVGLDCIEVTFRESGAAKAITAIRDHFPGMLVAAGTVLTVEQAREALRAGADVIVAPGTNLAVVEEVLSSGATMLPGVVTPTEIEANLARGITAMKFFPAEAMGGVAYLRAVYGPYRQVRFVPTGGVSAANLRAYLAVPNVLACGGTWIASVAALMAGDWQGIRRMARQAVELVREVRRAAAAEPDRADMQDK